MKKFENINKPEQKNEKRSWLEHDNEGLKPLHQNSGMSMNEQENPKMAEDSKLRMGEKQDESPRMAEMNEREQKGLYHQDTNYQKTTVSKDVTKKDPSTGEPLNFDAVHLKAGSQITWSMAADQDILVIRNNDTGEIIFDSGPAGLTWNQKSPFLVPAGVSNINIQITPTGPNATNSAYSISYTMEETLIFTQEITYFAGHQIGVSYNYWGYDESKERLDDLAEARKKNPKINDIYPGGQSFKNEYLRLSGQTEIDLENPNHHRVSQGIAGKW